MTVRHVTSAALAAVALLALAGCSPSYEGVTPEEFASVACGHYAETMRLEEANGDLWEDPVFDYEPGDRPDQKELAVTAADAALAQLEEARAEIADTVPAVRDGQAVTDAFLAFYDEKIAAGTPLIEELREIDTYVESNEIQSAMDDVFFEISIAGDFPFYDVEDQDVIEAIGANADCAAYVEVTSF